MNTGDLMTYPHADLRKYVQMDCAPKSSLPTVLDPFAASVIAQLHEQIASKDQALHAAEEIIQQLKEALRLERIRQFGKQSEKLSDLQLELLDDEPGVSSEEVAGEVERGPLPDASGGRSTALPQTYCPAASLQKNPAEGRAPLRRQPLRWIQQARQRVTPTEDRLASRSVCRTAGCAPGAALP